MYTLQFDGLFRGVPDSTGLSSKAGFMCYGWLITKDDLVIARGHGVCVRGIDATSNVAEYLALIEGLEALYDLGVQEEPVSVTGDAQTIIDQMRGEAMVHAPSMKPLYRRAKRLARKFVHLTWYWTPRRQNKDADLLTRRAMRQIRLDPSNYQEAMRVIAPGNGNRRRSHKLHSLLDLRVFQPAQLAFQPAGRGAKRQRLQAYPY